MLVQFILTIQPDKAMPFVKGGQFVLFLSKNLSLGYYRYRHTYTRFISSQREYWLTLVKKWIQDSVDELESIQCKSLLPVQYPDSFLMTCVKKIDYAR